MTVIRTDMIFIHKLTIMVSIPSPNSSPILISENCSLNIVCSVLETSILVSPLIAAAAELTMWLPTSNTAITMSKVLLNSMTAIHAFIKKRIKMAVLKSCRLFLSMTMEISS